MARKDSAVPSDWLARAHDDLQAARIVLHHEELPAVVGYLLHQSVEKALKAFLLARGRAVPRIHDLEALLDDAVESSPSLEGHRQLCVGAADFHALHT
ncbi:MAG TPA: HEPN domain-containing protein [Candidatus Thermoplasmatota archaeon]|jgi:HEPN domain-containing protein|nr:HEPN domain-containing protein [Candidatus Thermoplasmatota archaeon]